MNKQSKRSKGIDVWIEEASRGLARRTSRRGFLGRLGAVLVGGASLPLLPVSRIEAGDDPRAPAPVESGDAADCNYWRHCAIHGFLCACCGGSASTCPPGTEMSPITWIGTCRNPGDGKEYVISYNDCCGQSLCGRCLCSRMEGEQPVYNTFRNNDLLWCFGTSSRAVHCSVSVVVGLATKG